MINPFGGPPLKQVPEGIDPMEFGVLKGAEEIEKEVEKHGWDQLHMVWVIRRELVDVSSTVLAAGFGINLVHTIDDIPSSMTPDEYLMRFTEPDALRAMLQEYGPVPLEQIQALVFVGEAWGAFGTSDAEMHEAEQLHAQRKLHTMRGRVEIRQVVAIDRAERRYGVMRQRGQTDAQRSRGTNPPPGFEGERGLLAMMRTLQTL